VSSLNLLLHPCFEHTQTLLIVEERGRTCADDGNPRDLLDHAFMWSIARTSSVDFRVPPKKVLELGCGVCLFLLSLFTVFCCLGTLDGDGAPSLTRDPCCHALIVLLLYDPFALINCPPFLPRGELFSRVTGLSTLRRNGRNANLCV
jgi:hypothetical protein